MTSLKCPKCDSNKFEVIGKQKIKNERYGLLNLVRRQCSSCFRRYRVADNGIQEFLYN